jgi:uncharacterized damage-inducible protein DinB
MKLLLTAIALIVPAYSQTLSVKDALVKHWKVATEFTIAVAKAMPEDSWAFRPNPEEMSFGELIYHIGGANLSACANAANTKAPAIPAAILAASKEKKPADRALTIQFLEDSFKFCNEVVSGMTPEKLETVTGLGARKMSGFEWLWAYFTHTAHHRGQAEVYLRVKGIKPPDYAF